MIRVALLVGLFQLFGAQDLPSCDSKVYCQGQLLDTVQMAQIFNDSKTFVDMKMRNSVATTLANFDKFYSDTNQNPSKEQIIDFVNDNFESYNEFEDWTPPDWVQTPAFLASVQPEDVRTFAQDLVEIWPTLARKIKQEVLDSPEQFSLIPVDNGFVIPGGRFKEFYYWDSYWIVKGLLISEMHDTVKGMLDNFVSLVNKYGFIPNGARVYYLNRSQPPLLAAMVNAYLLATNDTEWLATNIKTLDAELRFWLDNRLIEVEKDGVIHTLAHYDSESGTPRPESYLEDVRNANYYPTEEEKKQLYAELKTGAESGWDFSSRWIVDDKGGNTANITFLKTRRIIPVDLNAYLCQAFRHISEFYVILNDFDNAIFWMEKSNSWQKTIAQVLYHETDGIWYDWNLDLGEHRRFFFPSNFAPLWAEAFEVAEASTLGKRAAIYFINQGVMDYEGGIPTSLSQTGEQWDYPNAWPPLQSIVIMGLDKSGDCDAKSVAKEFAHRWIRANMIGFNETDEMFEKYDAVNPGQYGGGGEYVIQTGFGWTNGAALELINHFFTSSERKLNH